MSVPAVFLYAEYQTSVPFEAIDWKPIDVEMKKFTGLLSKTWLSGLKTNSVGGFYAFDSLEHAQAYIDGLLIPFAAQVGGSLSVRLFDADVTREASRAIHSPFYPAVSAES
ncbi:YdhR family protein [Methylobacterium sp. J-048]|uniref:YdhR family protein n=1 Tax=Methylobacterium sp. J-048 TaxID=2836635 RepID=UPI001FBBA3CE|nr:YdhR family protein [Methylobacterium sp. J-048]MCJ2057402.1 YdhR family protein [Methylobacterium sp. J-048]